MGRSAVVVVEPVRRLGERGFGITEPGAAGVSALEGVHEDLRERNALRTLGRRGDRLEPQRWFEVACRRRPDVAARGSGGCKAAA